MIFFTDGFDYSYVDAVTGLPPGWSSSGGNGGNPINAVSARSGLQGMGVGGSSQGRFILTNFTARTTAIFGFAMNLQSGVSSVIFGLEDSTGSTQLEMQYNGTGGILVFKGTTSGTLLGTASVVINAGAWHYYELKITIASGTGGSFDLHIDGVSVASATGINTLATSTANMAAAWLQGPGGTNNFFDDVVFLDLTGTVNNTFLGDVSVLGRAATSNGTQNDFTQAATASWVADEVEILGQQITDSNGNIQEVVAITSDNKTGPTTAPVWSTTPLGANTTDNHVTWRLTAIAPLANFNFIDELAQDGDNTYLSSATVNNQERYDFAATTATKVIAVNVKSFMRKDDAGTRTVRVVAKSGATTVDNGADLPLTTGYTQVTALFEVDPNTTTAWTQTTLNAAEFGVKVTA